MPQTAVEKIPLPVHALPKETMREDKKGLEELRQYVTDLSQRELRESVFFSDLVSTDVPAAVIQHVFGQFYLWRNQFHRWFGLAISQSGSCTDPNIAMAVHSLANHIAIELGDHHDQLYRDFLSTLRIDEWNISKLTPSPATKDYCKSFDRIVPSTSFPVLVARIAAREFFASQRNEFVLSFYYPRLNVPPPLWWTLHSTLEADHFVDEIQPVIGMLSSAECLHEIKVPMAAEIRTHVTFWDDLYREAAQSTPIGSQ